MHAPHLFGSLVVVASSHATATADFSRFPNMTEQDVWWRLRPEVDEHTANKIGLTIDYLPTSRFATYCEEPKSREALAQVVTFHGNCKLRLRFKLVNLSYTIQYRDDAVAEFGMSP